MSGRVLTDFSPDPERLRPLLPCMDGGSGWEPALEWPCNLLSRKTVAYGDGKIARQGDVVSHRIDAGELALSQRLAAEAAELSRRDPEHPEDPDFRLDFAMDSESANFTFAPFYVVANVGDPVPERIDADLIRSRFGGTIFPPVRITVAPLAESGRWWEAIGQGEGHHGGDLRDMLAEGEPPAEDEEFVEEVREKRAAAARNLAAMRAFMRWFKERPEFKDVKFVAIGDHWGEGGIRSIPPSDWPPGTNNVGSAFPRLIVGLTHAGSLVGLFGHVVQT